MLVMEWSMTREDLQLSMSRHKMGEQGVHDVAWPWGLRECGRVYALKEDGRWEHREDSVVDRQGQIRKGLWIVESGKVWGFYHRSSHELLKLFRQRKGRKLFGFLKRSLWLQYGEGVKLRKIGSWEISWTSCAGVIILLFLVWWVSRPLFPISVPLVIWGHQLYHHSSTSVNSEDLICLECIAILVDGL